MSERVSLLPEGTGPARLIVLERSGRWAIALRRELAGRRVYETRSMDETWEMLQRYPASFLVVELTQNSLHALFARMAFLEREFPLARIAVAAARRWLGWQWAMREAGAVHFVVSSREVAPLAQVIGRHLDRAPSPQRAFTEQIWAELPWGRSEL